MSVGYSPLTYYATTVLTAAQSSNTYYMQESDQQIIVNLTSPAALQIYLVANPVVGKWVVIKDGAGNASSYSITISPSAGTIDGASTNVISTNYGHVRFSYNGTQWNVM
jgi:hypothetical protein